jgi:LuxR family transcriptional regulator, quorum-sensing system regulator BjaR1
MQIDHVLGDIAVGETLDDLKNQLHVIAGRYGFASYNFLDAGNLHDDVPYYFCTVDPRWEATYRDNNFIDGDPYVSKARRTNTPFTWASLPTPPRTGGRKPMAQKIMDAALDFRLNEGFLVPFHFRDTLGRYGAALIVYLWEDKPDRLEFMLSERRHELHLITIYWAQRVVEIIAQQKRERGSPFAMVEELNNANLTDRERGVLQWAARGKTVSETAEILKISDNTVETYLKLAYQKLNVVNKTHAVAKAIYNRLIDV